MHSLALALSGSLSLFHTHTLTLSSSFLLFSPFSQCLFLYLCVSLFLLCMSGSQNPTATDNNQGPQRSPELPEARRGSDQPGCGFRSWCCLLFQQSQAKRLYAWRYSQTGVYRRGAKRSSHCPQCWTNEEAARFVWTSSPQSQACCFCEGFGQLHGSGAWRSGHHPNDCRFNARRHRVRRPKQH